MKIFVPFEFSGRVTAAFRALGHEAYSCDLEPTEGNPAWHFQGDALPWLDWGWDIIVAFPPCTFIAQSAVHWLGRERGRVAKMKAGALTFRRVLEAKVKVGVCAENPIMCKRAQRIVGQNWTQLVEPFYFGDPYTKRTGLWLRGLPPLHVTKLVAPRKDAILNMGADPNDKAKRQKWRSLTPQGLAAAMAQQWGNLAA